MNNLIKYVTPVGVFTVKEDLNIYIDEKQYYDYDKSKHTNEPIADAIRYIEDEIVKRINTKRTSIQSQLDALNDELDSYNITVEPNVYRILQ